MALVKKTFTLGLDDCKVYPITADTATAYTVGSAVDVPTVQSISVEIEIDEKELLGDEAVRDIFTKAKKVNFSIEYGEMDLDLQAAILGGAVVASGTTPNQVQKYGYSLGTIDAYFQLAGKINYTDSSNDVGDFHINIMKCKINANSFNEASEEYGTLSFGGNGINTNYNFTAGKALYYTINETGASLAAIVSP